MNIVHRGGNRRLLVAESILATLAGVLAVVTTVWPQWIELLTGSDPDGGDGSLEWALVSALIAVALLATGLAVREALLLRGAAT